MTEAGWTRNAPTKEGWYWWKRTENDNPVIVWVNAFHPDKQLRAEMISGRRELLTHFTGLFNGPLSPTDRQQGKVEARDKLKRTREQIAGLAALAEHARAVRICRQARMLKFHGLRDTDTNEWLDGYEAACCDILNALQRGRGGKG